MKRANLVLHVGTEKTGTTHLQAFMKLNRERLRTFGIALTSDPTEDRSTLFAATPDVARSRDGLVLQTPEQREKFQAKYWAELDELSQSGAETVFISTERLGQLQPDLVKTFFDKISKYFDKITVVVYLRRADDLASSYYFLSIVTGKTKLPDDNFATSRKKTFDEAAIVRTWGEVVHPDTMIALPYLNSYKKDGNAVTRQVLTILGIPEEEQDIDKWQLPKPGINVRTSAEATEYLRQLNPLAPRKSTDGTWNHQRQRLRNVLAERFPGEPVRIPESTIVKILDLYPPTEAYDEALRLTSKQWQTDQFKADWQAWLDAPRAKSGEIPQIPPADVEKLKNELFGKPKLFGNKKPFSIGGDSRPKWRKQLSQTRSRVTKRIKRP